MMENLLQDKDLKNILYVIFDNYKYKNIDINLGEGALVDYVYDFIANNTPSFIKSDIKILKSDIKLHISSEKLSKTSDIEIQDKYNSQYSYETTEVVDYIFTLGDEEKAEFLKEIADKNSLSINDVYNIYLARTMWSDKNSLEKMESWIYNLTTPNALKKDLIDKMINIINRDINDDIVNDYLKRILASKESISLEYFSPKNEFYRLMLFDDLLSVDYKDSFNKKIAFDFDYIKIWWEKNILPIFVNKYEPENLANELNLEIKKYETVDFYGENFKKLKAVVEEIATSKAKEQERIEKKFSLDENKFLKRAVDSLDLDSVKSVSELSDIFKSVDFKYEENKYIRNDKFSEKLIELLEDGHVEMSIKELDIFVNENKKFFNEKVYIFMQVYIQKEIEKVKIKLEEDLKNTTTFEEIDKIQDEVLQNGEFVVCREIENIIMLKFEELVKKLNLADINDEEKIELGIKIYNKMEVVDISEYEIAGVFIDRDIVIDLDEKRETVDKLRDLEDDIYDIVLMNCMFNCDYYNLNIKVKGTDESYIMKFKYIDSLIEYINTSGKKTILFMLGSISSKRKYKRRIFRKGNADLIKEIDAFYDNKNK